MRISSETEAALTPELERQMAHLPEAVRRVVMASGTNAHERLNALADMRASGAVAPPAELPLPPTPRTWLEWAQLPTAEAAAWKEANPEAYEALRPR